jgi:hypothetical protein
LGFNQNEELEPVEGKVSCKSIQNRIKQKKGEWFVKKKRFKYVSTNNAGTKVNRAKTQIYEERSVIGKITNHVWTLTSEEFL